MMEIADIVALFAECMRLALPFTVIFWFCELVVSTVLRAAFGGKLSFKGF